jgi:hypothetical protein
MFSTVFRGPVDDEGENLALEKKRISHTRKVKVVHIKAFLTSLSENTQHTEKSDFNKQQKKGVQMLRAETSSNSQSVHARVIK